MGVLAFAAAATLGCSEASFPGPPLNPALPVAPPPPTPEPPPGPPRAVLAFTTLTAISRAVVAPGQYAPGQYAYDVTLVLAETGGASGAWISALTLAGPSGLDLGCPGQVIRIEPRSSWDMASVGYCAPGPPGGRSPTARLTVVVEFLDDEGRRGTLTSTVDAAP